MQEQQAGRKKKQATSQPATMTTSEAAAAPPRSPLQKNSAEDDDCDETQQRRHVAAVSHTSSLGSIDFSSSVTMQPPAPAGGVSSSGGSRAVELIPLEPSVFVTAITCYLSSIQYGSRMMMPSYSTGPAPSPLIRMRIARLICQRYPSAINRSAPQSPFTGNPCTTTTALLAAVQAEHEDMVRSKFSNLICYLALLAFLVVCLILH